MRIGNKRIDQMYGQSGNKCPPANVYLLQNSFKDGCLNTAFLIANSFSSTPC